MNCPYCNNEVIYGVRNSIKCIPKDKEKGMILPHFVKDIKLLE